MRRFKTALAKIEGDASEFIARMEQRESRCHRLVCEV
jgi:hypothetical protein